MTAPNMFIIYVADAPTAARFYSDLFDITPSFETPGFVAFDLSDGVQLALWNLPQEELDRASVRTSELCLALPANELIDEQFQAWKNKGVRIVSEPRDEAFGRTFVAADPDGNLIRVAPVD
ncbi:VOC family protein [Nesterenkonia ebinurensis]|uniref:VOC family protein n=1 Tax=Nesterenkonia ebinurensis TaxID=2608252 RepID=UPI00123C96E3|nr:VOC family protein [Nesterenkonia ebinurensis]